MKLLHTFSDVHSSFEQLPWYPERPNPTNNPGHHLLLNKYYWENTTEGGGGRLGLKEEDRAQKGTFVVPTKQLKEEDKEGGE